MQYGRFVGIPVRPTLRALKDLGLGFPQLDRALEDVGEPLIKKAQGLPSEVSAGGAERVLSLTDRVWFKVKTQDERGAAGDVPSPEGHEVAPGGWWLVAAGRRQQDTPSKDFYAQLEAECARAGKGTGGVSSEALLPSEIDYKRWSAERAALAISAMKRLVRKAVAKSAHDGHLWTVTIKQHVIGALVRNQDGETYLAITAEGYYDHRVVAILLDAIPGVAKEDWGAEPGAVFGIAPAEGQVIFSAMLPPETLCTLLDEDDGDYL
jgi:hypothetical protein